MERKTARKRRKDCTVGESAEMKGGDVMKARMQVLLEHWQVEETKRLSEDTGINQCRMIRTLISYALVMLRDKQDIDNLLHNDLEFQARLETEKRRGKCAKNIKSQKKR